jgi:prophage antirepressor-like protein
MNIVPFVFNDYEIRTLGSWEAPIFVAADVCAILEVTNVSQACDGLDEDEKTVYSLDMPGQSRNVICVTESGLYSLVLRSRKPEAKVFKKWITAVLLPTIRKTGQYSVSGYKSVFTDVPEQYQGPISPSRKKGLKPFKEKTEISEQQLKVYCFVKSCDRWMTNTEIAEGTGIPQTSIRSFVLYFSKAGLFDFMETHPKHLYRFSSRAEARHPGLYARMENAIRLLGDPLLRCLPSFES